MKHYPLYAALILVVAGCEDPAAPPTPTRVEVPRSANIEATSASSGTHDFAWQP